MDEAGPSTSGSDTGAGLLHQFALLQAIMERGYMLEKDAKQLFRKLTNSQTGLWFWLPLHSLSLLYNYQRYAANSSILKTTCLPLKQILDS